MDANNGMGMLASDRMMKMLVEKSKQCGMADGICRGLRNELNLPYHFPLRTKNI